MLSRFMMNRQHSIVLFLTISIAFILHSFTRTVKMTTVSNTTLADKNQAYWKSANPEKGTRILQ